MNINDISIDCESLGTAFDAPVIAIGAVCFDRTTGTLGPKFYNVVELNSAMKACRVDGSTLSWWLSQPRAQEIFNKTNQEHARSLATVLLEFSDWCRAQGKGVPRPWFKGPAQDATWIEHGMHVGGHGLAIPWHHTNVRCVRVITELAEEIAGFDVKSVKDVGTAHNALDDAIYQANVVSAAYKALRALNVSKFKLVNKPKPTDDDEL